MKKICSKCKIEKEITFFYKRNDSLDGYAGVCKICNYKYSKSLEQQKRLDEINKEKKIDILNLSHRGVPRTNFKLGFSYDEYWNLFYWAKKEGILVEQLIKEEMVYLIKKYEIENDKRFYEKLKEAEIMPKVVFECKNGHVWEFDIPEEETIVACPTCGKHPVALNNEKMANNQEIRSIRKPKQKGISIEEVPAKLPVDKPKRVVVKRNQPIP
jgi:hypothetical protein